MMRVVDAEWRIEVVRTYVVRGEVESWSMWVKEVYQGDVGKDRI